MKMAENWDIIEIRLYASQNNYVENKGDCYEAVARRATSVTSIERRWFGRVSTLRLPPIFRSLFGFGYLPLVLLIFIELLICRFGF